MNKIKTLDQRIFATARNLDLILITKIIDNKIVLQFYETTLSLYLIDGIFSIKTELDNSRDIENYRSEEDAISHFIGKAIQIKVAAYFKKCKLEEQES